MKFLLLLLLTVSTTMCFPQTRMDSLRTLLNSQNDTVDVATLLANIGFYHFEKRDYDSAIFYYKKALNENGLKTDLPLSASSQNALGASYSSIGELDSSISYYQKALLTYEKLGDSDAGLVIESNLSIIYKNKGLYDKALEHSFNALSKLEKGEPDRALASCYNTIGLVYAETNDFDKALTFHRKALGVRKRIDYQRGVGQSLNNIGDVFMRLKNYDSALSNLTRALQVKMSIGERPAVTLNNIGEILVSLNRVTEAQTYFEQSLAIRREQDDQIGQSVVLSNMGNIELLRHNLSKANSYFDEAERLARQTGSLNQLRTILERQLILYDQTRDLGKALVVARELLMVKDSLLNKEKAESLLNMQTKYETEKKEQQIEILETEKNLQDAQLSAHQTWIKGLVIFAILLTMIVSLIVNQYLLIRKNKARIETLLNELHHRVKNNLQTLSSLFMLQARQLTDATAIQAVKSSESRVNAMALIHRKLYHNNQSTVVDMKEYVDELAQYLVSSYGYRDHPFQLNLDIEEIRLDVDKAISLGLILNELMSNAFKYAFASNPDPKLDLKITLNRGEELEIKLSDNGSGFEIAKEDELLKSFGLRMVKSLLQDLKGRMETQSLNGTVVFLNIPIITR